MNSKGIIAGIILIIAGISAFILYDKIVKPELDAKAIVSESKLIMEKGDKESCNQAITVLRKVLVNYPDTKSTAEAYFLTGQAYEKLELYRLAYLKYSYLFKAPLSKKTPAWIIDQARISMNKIRIIRNYSDEGMHNLYTMLDGTTNPDLRSRVYSELGQAYLKNNDSKKALSSFDIALQENNANEEAIIGKARSLKRAKLTDQSFAMYDYFLKYYGQTSPYANDVRSAYKTELYDTALSAFRAGNYKGSIYYMSNFLTRFGSDNLAENALYWCGESYFAMKQFPQAISYFDKVLSNKWYNKDEDALIKKGYAYFISKRFDLAAREFQTYLKMYPRGKYTDDAKRWKEMSASELKRNLDKFKAPESDEPEVVREKSSAEKPAPKKQTPREVKPEKADIDRQQTPASPSEKKSKDSLDDENSNPLSDEEVSGYKEIEIDNIAEM